MPRKWGGEKLAPKIVGDLIDEIAFKQNPKAGYPDEESKRPNDSFVASAIGEEGVESSDDGGNHGYDCEGAKAGPGGDDNWEEIGKGNRAGQSHKGPLSGAG
jgi:hypothetical protein